MEKKCRIPSLVLAALLFPLIAVAGGDVTVYRGHATSQSGAWNAHVGPYFGGGAYGVGGPCCPYPAEPLYAAYPPPRVDLVIYAPGSEPPPPAPAPEMMIPEPIFIFDKTERTEVWQGIEAVKQYLAANAGVITVVGYTDECQTDAYNVKLGMRRAVIVKNLLVSGGVDASRLKVRSGGEDNLNEVTGDSHPACRRQVNRRVEFEDEKNVQVSILPAHIGREMK